MSKLHHYGRSRRRRINRRRRLASRITRLKPTQKPITKKAPPKAKPTKKKEDEKPKKWKAKMLKILNFPPAKIKEMTGVDVTASRRRFAASDEEIAKWLEQNLKKYQEAKDLEGFLKDMGAKFGPEIAEEASALLQEVTASRVARLPKHIVWRGAEYVQVKKAKGPDTLEPGVKTIVEQENRTVELEITKIYISSLAEDVEIEMDFRVVDGEGKGEIKKTQATYPVWRSVYGKYFDWPFSK